MSAAHRNTSPEDRDSEPRNSAQLEAGRVHFGVKWTAISLFALRFGRLFTTIVLARILTREMFGLVTLSMAFIMAFQALRDVGFGHAYVQRKGLGPEEDQRAASTVFWVTSVLNVGMFCVGFAIAPYAAEQFPKLEGLTPILRGTFAVLLIEAFSMAPTAILQKRLDFGHVAAGEMVGVALNAVFSIALACAGAGAWSIVLGTLGARLCQTLTVIRFAAWTPRCEFDRGLAREMFGFGKYLWGTSLLGASNKIVDKLLLGRIAGDAALGVYGNAYNLCTTASKPLYSIVLRVAFPTMSRIQDDVGALRAGFMRATSGIALLTVPLAVGLALTASDFVVTVYGANWADMAPLTRVLAFYGLVMSIASVSGPVLMATGRPRALFFFTLAGQVLLIGLLVAAGGHGTLGIAWAVLVAALLAEGAGFIWAASRVGLDLAAAFAPIARSASAALVMGAVVRGVQWLVGEAVHPALRLTLAVIAGVATFGAAAYALNRRDLEDALSDLRSVAGAKGRAKDDPSAIGV
ncbi:MAG: lipopolysaccharide biosynthesis protein [Planctomycetota bacterium]